MNETLRIVIRSRTGIPDHQVVTFTDLDGELHVGYRWVNLGLVHEKDWSDSYEIE